MSLSPSQQKRCLEVMDKLCSRKTSQMFANPVDPVRDSCPNYFDIVKTPMDLGTVRRKLNDGQYKSVADWKSDVNLIWSNSNAYNSKTSLLRAITKDLSDLYHKLTVYLSDSPQNDWNDEINTLSSELNQIMKEMSDPANDVTPIPILPPLVPMAHDKKPKSSSKIKTQPKTLTSQMAMSASPSTSFSPYSQNQPIQTRLKSKKYKDKDLPGNDGLGMSELSYNDRYIFGRDEKKHISSKSFSKDQLQQLSHDINSLEDDGQVDSLIDIIKSSETDFRDNGGEIEVDLNILRSGTLRLLREHVDTLLDSNYM